MTKASKYFKVEGDKLVRTHRTCPKCGEGYYLADHYDRQSCGKCGYTIFKRSSKKGKRVKRRTSSRRSRSRRKSRTRDKKK
ncbi:MAG: 30S ribosomal protein S27ae [Promethearchaeia archaeon]